MMRRTAALAVAAAAAAATAYTAARHSSSSSSFSPVGILAHSDASSAPSSSSSSLVQQAPAKSSLFDLGSSSSSSSKPRPAPLPKYRLLPSGALEILDPGFERVTDKLASAIKVKEFKKNHAIHETLSGTGKVEQYEIYVKRETEELVAVIKFGKAINGYPGIVHGGILSLMMDDTYGMLFLSLSKPLSATANLSVNYRSPVYAGSTVVLHCKLDKVDGRKLHMSGSVQDAKTGKLLCDSTSLFVSWKRAFDLPWWAEPLKPLLGHVVRVLYP